MKLVFFCAGGELGLRPLEAAAADHLITAVVRPAPGGAAVKRLLRHAARAAGFRRDPIRAWTRRTGVPTFVARSADDPAITSALQNLEPDLICISTFPWLLGPAVLEVPRHGAVNVHPSLLPRHRGPNPYFWTYYHGDAEAGVTVHQASARADAGPILLQESFLLPRGQRVERLHARCAELGAKLLVETLGELSRAVDAATPQDESLATPAPRVKPGVAMVDYDRWDVEQVWHFLAGLCGQYWEPLQYRGRPVTYRTVLGFERVRTGGDPGSLERTTGGWRLACQGGYVRLSSHHNSPAERS